MRISTVRVLQESKRIAQEDNIMEGMEEIPNAIDSFNVESDEEFLGFE
jgi:hypothetical protein